MKGANERQISPLRYALKNISTRDLQFTQTFRGNVFRPPSVLNAA
jgi:hypothetical protein